jgi:hypothetical protein
MKLLAGQWAELIVVSIGTFFISIQIAFLHYKEKYRKKE